MIWVDGNDPEWQRAYFKYAEKEEGDKRMVRFRDWETLKYWFRGVETFAPWVDKVHFVTCGHYPEWLNLNHPKLNFVRHSDYIPSEYLPTFNSHTIELNLHRIKGLGEEFVYFNDDTYIIAPLKPTRFFRNGLPRDIAALNAISPCGGIMHIHCNNTKYVNDHYNKSEVLKKNFTKWFNPKYGSYLIRTLGLLLYKKFTGILDPHMPNAYKKSTFERVWKENFKLLESTCKYRFRSDSNVSQYVMRYTQLVEGRFDPINPYRTSFCSTSIAGEALETCLNIIRTQNKQMICINDDDTVNFDEVKEKTHEAFETILSKKSTFEL